MMDFDFRKMSPRLGGQRESFEELCCQLASRTLPEGPTFTRLHGSGGDGGVECYADLPDGTRTGWQAKYVFDIDALITQAGRSLDTALKVHENLSLYIVCFPFNLTGPTRRKGKSQKEKFDAWCNTKIEGAKGAGRQLKIEAWPAHKLRSLLLDLDTAGGIREYFFNQKILSRAWFAHQFESARETAGPRYTPELNVETDLGKWFASFGRTRAWVQGAQQVIRECREPYKHFARAVQSENPGSMSPAWPEDLREDARSLSADIDSLIQLSDVLLQTIEVSAYKECVARTDLLIGRLNEMELSLVRDLEVRHRDSWSDSPGFRQFNAEYMVSFPAANLDVTREMVAELERFGKWLRSPAGRLAFRSTFVLSGVGGSGKTHGACDAAYQRLDDELLSCVVFGHEFGGEPDPWTRILESLELPISLGRDGLLDALESAAEASGAPLVIFLDAINETKPLRYWHDRLPAVVQAIRERPYLRLCVICRTSYLPHCLPDGHGLDIVEHRGFEGIEREACNPFFQHYGLTPPLTPTLQPELANPLYLRLVCETLKAQGLRELPSGWHGIAPTIRAFLSEKEKQFSAEHETALAADIVGGSLRAIARAVADSGVSVISRSQAQNAISRTRPQADALPVLDWLVHADLLTEDAPLTRDQLGTEGVVRPAFERLGDFLIASELLDQAEVSGLKCACESGGLIWTFVNGPERLANDVEVLAALSVLLPEKSPHLELPELTEDYETKNILTRTTVRALPWRDPAAITAKTCSVARNALKIHGFSGEALDALLSVTWRASEIDAIWFHKFLARFPLARRDGWWCGYLHQSFENDGTVARLIDAASELPLDEITSDVAERWATALLWFTAAADRRVKEEAMRAATAVLAGRSEIILSVMKRMLGVDDNEVRERTLLSCYAVMIVAHDAVVTAKATVYLQQAFTANPRSFDNALIRDHIRCIAELARELSAVPEGCDPELTMRPIGTPWPLQIPSDAEIEEWRNLPWEDLPKLVRSCLSDDFFTYSLRALDPWVEAVPKTDMAKWILQRIVRGFDYHDSDCKRYDAYMFGKYGGGRAKPVWAERIGKKYQWITMYQLASRLHDHAERKRDCWEPEPLCTPLILLEERKLDPTLPPKAAAEESRSDVWWITPSVDFRSSTALTDEKWVERKDDIPLMEDLLSVVEHGDLRRQLLVSHPKWNSFNEEYDRDEPYRQLWMHIQSYLVPKKDVEAAYKSLHRRNLFGEWMPRGASWLYGFAGEYPWGTAFNTEPESWHGRGSFENELPVTFSPTWNSLTVEWEYDPTHQENFQLLVPSRDFFSPSDLWWNGLTGFKVLDGRTVFEDPSASEGGPSALMADADDLLERLNKLGSRLIWTLLGEKLILGGRDMFERRPQRLFCQVAVLKEDGSIQFGDRAFFDDYDQDTGPAENQP